MRKRETFWPEISFRQVLIGIGVFTATALMFGLFRTTDGERDCAGKMRRIAQAYNVYLAEYGDASLRLGWQDPAMLPYLKVRDRSELYCSETESIRGLKFHTYRDLVVQNFHFQSTKQKPHRELPGGWIAPEFDIHSDALIKCTAHGIRSPGKPGWPGLVTQNRGRLIKLQTVYLDGRIQQAPPDACWEWAWRPLDIEKGIRT